jgi:RNA polymerase sigma-70 factor (family 1)
MFKYRSYDDEALLARLRTDDDRAFTELYDRYHERVYGYILMQVKLPVVTEDSVHEIFLKLWEIRHQLELHGSFASYLFRMAHNKGVDAMRNMARDRVMRSELLDQYAMYVGWDSKPAEELARIDNLLEEALSTLTPQRRTVYELCKQQGKTYQQAAETLGISANTVKEHMAKALAGLRHFLQEKGELTLLLIVLSKNFIER